MVPLKAPYTFHKLFPKFFAYRYLMLSRIDVFMVKSIYIGKTLDIQASSHSPNAASQGILLFVSRH